jgi:hypothetical protein
MLVASQAVFLHDRKLASPEIERLLSTMPHNPDIEKMHVTAVRRSLAEYEVRGRSIRRLESVFDDSSCDISSP